MALISANFSKTLVIQLEKENEVSVLDISESDSMSDDLKKLLSNSFNNTAMSCYLCMGFGKGSVTESTKWSDKHMFLTSGEIEQMSGHL